MRAGLAWVRVALTVARASPGQGLASPGLALAQAMPNSWVIDQMLIMNQQLNKAKSMVVLPREGSLWRLYWVGSGEGRSRFSKYFSFRRLDRSDWFERGAKLDRWFFGRVPLLLLRASTVRSPRVAAARDDGGSLSSPLGRTEGGYIERWTASRTGLMATRLHSFFLYRSCNIDGFVNFVKCRFFSF